MSPETETYQIRDWQVGDKTFRVRVQHAPGRFEGEPIFAQYFEAMAGDADYSEYEGDMVAADYFRSPFNVDGMPETEALEALTEDELDAMNAAYGAILSYSSNGFVYLSMVDTEIEFDAAIAAAERREFNEEEESTENEL